MIETRLIKLSDTKGTDSVERDARTTAPDTRRMVEVVSCDEESQRLYRSFRYEFC